MNFVILYTLVSAGWFVATALTPVFFLILGYCIFLLLKRIVLLWSLRFVYETGIEKERWVTVPEKIPVKKTKMVTYDKPVFGYYTRTKRVPVQKLRTVKRKVPVYKQVTKTRPKYKTVKQEQQVWKDTSTSYTVYDDEDYTDYEYYQQITPYQSAYNQGGSMSCTRTVTKTRQVPRKVTDYSGHFVKKLVDVEVEDGTEEVTVTVQDGFEKVTREEMTTEYEDVDEQQWDIKSYKKVTKEVEYIDHYELTGKQVSEKQTYQETIPASTTLKTALESYSRGIVAVCASVMMIVLQVLSFGAQLYMIDRARANEMVVDDLW